MKIASRPMLSRYARPGPEPTITGRTLAAAAARSSTSSPFSGASRATLRTATSASRSPSAARTSLRLAARSSARSIQAATSIVFAKTRTRAGSAPSATTDSRASEPTTSTDAAPRTIGGTAVVFTSRRQPAFGPASWLSTSRTYGTRRRRHQATAACEANVLQPETTTTSGSARLRASKIDERDRVVVTEASRVRPGRSRR